MSELKLTVIARLVKFPQSGWLSTHTTEPSPSGRVLVEVRGHSGCSRWVEALLTVPYDAIRADKLADGVYRVEETQDRRGQRLLRFFHADGDAEFVLISIPGFVVPDASEGEVVVLAKASGHSRTGRHGDRWSLVAVRPGSVVAYEGYYRGDPTYVQVTWDGLVPLGESDAVLPPSEW